MGDGAGGEGLRMAQED
uniref:Uncharacterized protein n=1 Tax=Arundo donax TaxID=35708 RepID=A0A0A9F9X3_ARUDO